MIDNNFINGLIEIAGPHDSGKSSEACAYYTGNPKGIAFIDTDLKGRSTSTQMQNDGFPFGLYLDLRADVQKEDWDKYFHTVNKTVDMLEKEGFPIVIWDTWNSVYIACKAEVVDSPHIYNKLYGGRWSKDYIIKNGEISREAKRVESSIINRILNFANTLIITSHLKNHYRKNPVTGKGEQTGKQIPKSSDTITEIARLRLWLTRTPEIKVPTALVLKNIDRKVYIEGLGLRTKPVLPFKIVPNTKLPEEENGFQPSDMSIWDTIRRYWKNPVGQRDFLDCEIPNEEEKSIIDGSLTREQKIMWMASIKYGNEKKEIEKQLFEQENKAIAIELFEQGKNISQISEELGIDLQKVAQWISQK